MNQIYLQIKKDFNLAIEQKDMAKIQFLYNQIEQIATIDFLTQSLVRWRIEGILSDTINIFSSDNGHFSIALLDIDNFKSINDNYGHLTGDEVLRKIARIIREDIRETDYLGRWGGDEFLIIFPSTAKNVASRITDHIGILVESNVFCGEKVSTSAGCVQFTRGDAVESIISKADKALYNNKKMEQKL